MWFDSHCHLPSDGSAPSVVDDAVAGGVLGMVNVGTSLASSVTCIDTARGLDRVWASAGVHPHDATDGVDGLDELLDAPEIVAVGEAGLDYHYMNSPAAEQRRVFAAQIELANRRDLPLIIHTREAWDETFEILDAEGTPARTVLHCFTGGVDEMTECVDRGMYVSFSGIVTFPRAPEVRAAAQRCPLDRLLVETDAPYLAPVPHRGRTNRPAWVACVGEAVAEERGIAASELASATAANAATVFGMSVIGEDLR